MTKLVGLSSPTVEQPVPAARPPSALRKRSSFLGADEKRSRELREMRSGREQGQDPVARLKLLTVSRFRLQ